MEKIKRFCPRCWGENEYDAAVCASCGKDLLDGAQESYVDKLLWALHHPVAEIAIRAIYILGEMKVQKAVPALEALCQQSEDIFLKKEAKEALKKIAEQTAAEPEAADR